VYLAHVSAKMITIEECVISSISCAQKYLEHSGDETQSITFVWCCGGARIGERICIVWTTECVAIVTVEWHFKRLKHQIM